MKFGKNREVDKRYLNVPAKYILNYTGANEGGKDKYDYPSYEEWVEEMKEFLDKNPLFKDYLVLNKETFEDFKKSGHVKERLVKKGKDKTLCIVDFYGKHLALVGWRNADTFSVGKTRLCRVIYKNDKVYIRYKGKNIPISDKSGWVL
jgi:hypothetical protein